ncbi:hypothetical protein GM1_003_00680 [Gordonia malaquae NBRC 108250]|uniref:Uncharacterized protein n=2 Tax=Gordoniaceae TaxID=85026 RepID=M3TAA6_GORML|nr:hypothetical protein GM1_003_00680 [Gordonia malaquae NBRC 108250]
MMPLFDDDELREYYQRMEDRTAAAHARPRRRRREVPTVTFTCPTPEKIAYDDYPAVMGAILAISRASRARPSLRCYECRCGFWHLTSGIPRPS